MFFIGSFSHIDKLAAEIPELFDILTQVRELAKDEFVATPAYICNDRIKVNREEVTLVPVGEKKLEWHRDYIDIHVPLSGEEILGWKPVDQIQNITLEYDPDKDIAFSNDDSQELIRLKPGEFVIFNPSDAHAPCQGNGVLRKFCVKIPKDYFLNV